MPGGRAGCPLFCVWSLFHTSPPPSVRAQAFATTVEELGGARIGEVVWTTDVASIGRCLERRLSEHRHPDSAAVEQVAGILVEAFVPVVDHWRFARRPDVLRGLCALASGLHPVCREDAAAVAR